MATERKFLFVKDIFFGNLNFIHNNIVVHARFPLHLFYDNFHRRDKEGKVEQDRKPVLTDLFHRFYKEDRTIDKVGSEKPALRNDS